MIILFSYNDRKNNIGLKIMKRMGYDGQDFGKHEHGMRKLINQQ